MATTKKDFQAAGGLPKYSTFYCGTLQAALKASAIQSVAGVGQEAAASMAKEGVCSTNQLISKYLSYHGGEDSDTQEACDHFHDWLLEHRVECPSLATQAVAEQAYVLTTSAASRYYGDSKPLAPRKPAQVYYYY